MVHQSVATRSIRRKRRENRPPSRAAGSDEAALQIFVFRADRFLGTMMFDGNEPILVGRHKNASLRLEGDNISRRHCHIRFADGRVFVEDLKSGNGTFINRERVMRREPLRSTDGLCIGGYTLKVRTVRATPLAPIDEAAAERTTKIEAILEADRTDGTDEVGIDLAATFDHALYEDAIRRQTGGERARRAEAPRNASVRGGRRTSRREESPETRPKLVAEPHLVRPRHALDSDSTMLAAQELSLRPDSERVSLDPEVEARLKDLDDLIASLDARYGQDRRSSSLPWRNEEKSVTDAPIPAAEIAEDSSVPSQEALSTREFARDLASRLALDGSVVPEKRAPIPTVVTLDEDNTEQKDEADLAPANDERPITAEEARKNIADVAELRALRAANAAMDEGPETELMDEDISLLREPRLPSIVRSNKVPIPEKERPPIHEARLVTPTPQAQPALRPDGAVWKKVDLERSGDDSAFYDDVWTNASLDGEDIRGPAFPRVLVERAAPNAERGPKIKKSAPTHARPKSRIDDFDPTAPRPPPRALKGFDGVEIAARAQGRLVDIAVLRSGGEQYILGHRTPQGAVAPGRAHLGLRLLRINDDRSVDLVFPEDVGGHLVRGAATVMFRELSEGRRYSCLRLEADDVATIVLGTGKNTISYHVRFLRRPKSLFRSLRRSTHDASPVT